MSTFLLFLCSFILIITGELLAILTFTKDLHPVICFIGVINIILGFAILITTCIEIGKQGNSNELRIKNKV